MSTRTSTTKGLSKPHKHEAARPGIGASMSNAKSIATEKAPRGPKSVGGVASTYFGNARACNTERGTK